MNICNMTEIIRLGLGGYCKVYLPRNPGCRIGGTSEHPTMQSHENARQLGVDSLHGPSTFLN